MWKGTNFSIYARYNILERGPRDILAGTGCPVKWYGLAFAIGFIAGYSIVARMFKHEGAPEKWLGILLMYLMAGTVVGARVSDTCSSMNGAITPSIQAIFSKIWEGGLASHGGTIALIIALFIFSWCVSKETPKLGIRQSGYPHSLCRRSHPAWQSDEQRDLRSLHRPALGFQYSFGTARPCPHIPHRSMKLCVTSSSSGCSCGCTGKRMPQNVPGSSPEFFFIGIFLPRFLIEFVKNVQVSSEYGLIERYGLNMGQMLSLPFILLGVILVIVALKRPRVKFSFPDRFPDADGTSAEKKENKSSDTDRNGPFRMLRKGPFPYRSPCGYSRTYDSFSLRKHRCHLL